MHFRGGYFGTATIEPPTIAPRLLIHIFFQLKNLDSQHFFVKLFFAQSCLKRIMSHFKILWHQKNVEKIIFAQNCLKRIMNQLLEFLN